MRRSAKTTLGFFILATCMGADGYGCNRRQESELQRIQRGQKAVYDSAGREKVLEDMELLRKQALIAAHQYYLNGDPGKVIELLKWHRRSKTLISTLGELNAASESANLIVNLMTIVGVNKSSLKPQELAAFDKIEAFANGSTDLLVWSSYSGAGYFVIMKGYIEPMIHAIDRRLARLVYLYREENSRHLEEELGPDVIRWNVEPGKRTMFDFMVFLKKSESDEQVNAALTQGVLDYFKENRSNLNDIFEELDSPNFDKIPTQGVFTKSIDRNAIVPWTKKHKDDLWILLYGQRKVPDQWRLDDKKN